MRATKTTWVLALLAVVVAGAGCGSRMVKLDPKKVRSVRVVLADRGESYCPAKLLAEVVAVVEYTDGRVFETWAPANRNGKLRAHDLAWTAEVGVVEDNGVMTMPLDLLGWHDRVFAVRAQVPTRPELRGEQRVKPRFDCAVVAEASGLDGRNDASQGGAGKPGGAGPRVEVALAYVDTKLHGRLVFVRVRDRDLGRWEYYLVDRRAGQRLTIAAKGGDGGAGGNGAIGVAGQSGQRGADGASGGMCENGRDGQSGTDGQPGSDGRPGGHGGDGGRGATVTVRYPAAFPELLQAIDISVAGGAGGQGGSGGAGGEGGAGGSGGNGGSAGPTSDPTQACTTSAGSSGPAGRKGENGRAGSAGAAGNPGAPGTIEALPSNMREVLAFELGRGWTLTLP